MKDFNFKIIEKSNEGDLFQDYDEKPFGIEYISFDDIIINDDIEKICKKENSKNSKYLETNNDDYTE
ncbi:UNVERIFIED_CONTAM: hypothetical protein MUK63_06980 [Blautia caecimuris]